MFKRRMGRVLSEFNTAVKVDGGGGCLSRNVRFTQEASSREGAGEMALRCLPCKCEDRSLVLRTYGFFL